MDTNINSVYSIFVKLENPWSSSTHHIIFGPVTCTQVEAQEVLAITFHPDKAVACFLPPQEPLVLTKGLTPKPFRRGKGKSRCAAGHETVSLPDTAPGEYQDWDELRMISWWCHKDKL